MPQSWSGPGEAASAIKANARSLPSHPAVRHAEPYCEDQQGLCACVWCSAAGAEQQGVHASVCSAACNSLRGQTPAACHSFRQHMSNAAIVHVQGLSTRCGGSTDRAAGPTTTLSKRQLAVLLAGLPVLAQTPAFAAPPTKVRHVFDSALCALPAAAGLPNFASSVWPACSTSCQPSLRPAHTSELWPQVFVAGSTGQTGKQVVAALRAQKIAVVAGVRVRSRPACQYHRQYLSDLCWLCKPTSIPSCIDHLLGRVKSEVHALIAAVLLLISTMHPLTTAPP